MKKEWKIFLIILGIIVILVIATLAIYRYGKTWIDNEPINIILGDVVLTTEKSEYNKGEEVKVTIKNNLDGEIEFWIIGIGSEEIKEDSNIWKDVRRDIDCSCMALCEKMAIILSSGEERSFIWDQTGDDCQQVEAGKYRARADWTDPRKEYLEVPAVVSNEFIIK